MTIQFVGQIIIALLIGGFILWAVDIIVAPIPAHPVIKQVIRAILLVAAVAIILFYAVLPILHVLLGINVPSPGIK